MNNIDPSAYIKFQMLILQAEEYDLERFIKSVIKSLGHIPSDFRKPIIWTGKFRIINTGSLILLITTAYLFSILSGSPVIFLVLAIAFSYIYFVFLALSVAVFTPFDMVAKKIITTRATRKIRQYPDLTVIGVAGSYGKTLMKEMLYAVLSEKFRVLKTPENINTPVGISRLIVRQLKPQTQILLVEMGEYYPTDIRKLCQITPPTIGVITGINEAHLERMGTLAITGRTIFELAQEVKPNGMLVLNASDPRVVENASLYATGKDIYWYSQNPTAKDRYPISDYKFHEDKLGISFDLNENGKRVCQISLPLLARYVVGDVIAAATIGRKLGLSWAEISLGVAKVTAPPHRLQPMKNENSRVLVIDDSYNGNPDGVTEAIRVLSEFKNHRKIYITPGLVEMGSRKVEIHRSIGKQLAPVSDMVILIKNSVTPFIAEGLLTAGFAKDNIIWYPNATECHKKFVQYIKPNDVVMFQNDWPDNYI
jgi:UDP-N-acetylmuramoyl-tripeptide--D-alanyl-D-alanine ligase